MRQCGQKWRAEGPPPEAAVAPSAAAGAAAPIYVTPAPVWGPPAAAAAPVPMEGAEAAAAGEAPPATPRPLQGVALGASPPSQPSLLAAAAAGHQPYGWPPFQQQLYPPQALQPQPIQPQLLHPSVAALRGSGMAGSAGGGSRRCFSAPTSPRAASTGGSGGRTSESPQTLIRLPPGSRLVLGDVEIEAMGSGDSGGAGMADAQGGGGTAHAGSMPVPAFPSVPPNSPIPAGDTGYALAQSMHMPGGPMFASQSPFPGWVDPAAAAEFAFAQQQQAAFMQQQQVAFAQQQQAAAAAAAWAAGGMVLLPPEAGLPPVGYGHVGGAPAAVPPMPAASYSSAHSPHQPSAAPAAAAALQPPTAQHEHPLRRPSSHKLPLMANLGSAAALDPATLAVAALGDAAAALPLGDPGRMGMQQGDFAPQAATGADGSRPACGPQSGGGGRILLTSSTLSMERDLDLLAHGGDME